jgi:hypothetical protein
MIQLLRKLARFGIAPDQHMPRWLDTTVGHVHVIATAASAEENALAENALAIRAFPIPSSRIRYINLVKIFSY